MVQKFMVLKFGVDKFMVEKSGVGVDKLRMIEMGHDIGDAERGHLFFRHHILAKKVCSQKL